MLLIDRIDRLRPGIEIARASRRIAVESVVAGIGLSVLGVVAAAFGYLTPVQGALLQEAIDVAIILNALRALSVEPRELPAPAPRAETSVRGNILKGTVSGAASRIRNPQGSSHRMASRRSARRQ